MTSVTTVGKRATPSASNRSRPVSWERREVRRAVLERDGSRCVYCGIDLRPATATPPKSDDLTLDHILPAEAGGHWALDNLLASCFACNNQRGCRFPPPPLRADAVEARALVDAAVEVRASVAAFSREFLPLGVSIGDIVSVKRQR